MICSNLLIMNYICLTFCNSDGMSRSGVFITCMSEIERVKVEGGVDIFQTVKAARAQRPHMVYTTVSNVLRIMQTITIDLRLHFLTCSMECKLYTYCKISYSVHCIIMMCTVSCYDHVQLPFMSERRQGFQPCCEAGIREPTLFGHVKVSVSVCSFVSMQEQFKMCYLILQSYLELFNTYSNYKNV